MAGFSDIKAHREKVGSPIDKLVDWNFKSCTPDSPVRSFTIENTDSMGDGAKVFLDLEIKDEGTPTRLDSGDQFQSRGSNKTTLDVNNSSLAFVPQHQLDSEDARMMSNATSEIPDPHNVSSMDNTRMGFFANEKDEIESPRSEKFFGQSILHDFDKPKNEAVDIPGEKFQDIKEKPIEPKPELEPLVVGPMTLEIQPELSVENKEQSFDFDPEEDSADPDPNQEIKTDKG
jgi:hypothetical protein